MNKYQVFIKSPNGSKTEAIMKEFQSLKAGRADRSIYSCELIVPATDLDINALEEDMLIEIWRDDGYGNMSIDGKTLYFLRKFGVRRNSEGADYVYMKGLDSLYLLTSRINAYAAGNANAIFSTYADDVCHSVMSNNFGSGAIASRLINTAYILTGSGSSLGASITKNCAWQELPSLLQDITDQSRNAGTWITYDIEYTGTLPLVFKSYIDYRGQDKSKFVTLSPDDGNLADPELMFDFENEGTAAYLLAAGEKSARIIGRADAFDRIAKSPWARREVKKENTQISVQASADNEARELLAKYRSKISLTGKIVQTENTIYGEDWDYGDLVTAQWYDKTFLCRILTYQINYANSGGNFIDEVDAMVRGEA